VMATAPSMPAPTEAKPAPAVPQKSPRPTVADRDRMRAELRKSGVAALTTLRELGRSFVDAADPPQRIARLSEIHRKAGFLTQMAAAAECHRLARLADALEALTFELQEKPKLINESTQFTIASTVALLAEMVALLDDTEEPPLTAEPRVLIVDNDPVSNRALAISLGRMHLRTTTVTDSAEALQRLQRESFDLILLDIDMPGMDGLALCEKLRALPQHRTTPVVFVTGVTDPLTRAHSMLSGGTDYVTKPVLPIELCVKAVKHLVGAGAR
jgi:CheY-like chemotaxis protein